ncbi:MAG: hypothetical protein V1829_02400 [bacterium]
MKKVICQKCKRISYGWSNDPKCAHVGCKGNVTEPTKDKTQKRP